MPSNINTNLRSLNAQRNFNASQGVLHTSLQCLSFALRVTTSAFQVLLIVSLLAFAAQGIPFLATHSAVVISSVQLGYWLLASGAVLLCATIIWILLSKN